MKKKKECKHFWDFIDKWIDSGGTTHWEFFCKYCLEIRVETRKKRKIVHKKRK
ncbi:MAG: hypothetical protein KAT94_04310 [Candidatus Aenigmarchaeota archaeon]|nr:hypothetical protein [Candidatus Aenigmarchaeota archaeon]MCK4532069.1 hypothetical protein [Candidatus Aenigmarchaeota archaeon]